MRVRRRTVGLFVALLSVSLALYAAGPLSRFARAVEFLSSLDAPAKGAEKTEPNDRLVEENVEVPSERGPIRARLYFRAERPKAPGIVIAHGVHHDGIDERRLVAFARALARTGRVVLTPELAELADYRITASGVSVIRDSVAYALERADHVEGERVGLIGFSFAGGLALVAASDPNVGQRLGFVTSVGGHHDL
ncbi:MAG TPA: hypothetical protein VF103_13040, partial [Polyangiaceae bacterium]